MHTCTLSQGFQLPSWSIKKAGKKSGGVPKDSDSFIQFSLEELSPAQTQYGAEQ